MQPEVPTDVDTARELLAAARLNNRSERLLAAAQVHAALAVEAAVRELIDALDADRGSLHTAEGSVPAVAEQPGRWAASPPRSAAWRRARPHEDLSTLPRPR